MRGFLGLDCGTSYYKISLFVPAEKEEKLRSMLVSFPESSFREAEGGVFALFPVERIYGDPVKSVHGRLVEILKLLRRDGLNVSCAVTGRIGKSIAEKLGWSYENEFRCIVRAVNAFHPEVRTVFEIGAETSKYLLLRKDGCGGLSLSHYGTNGECAAGTGSFMDQQASRLRVPVEEMGRMVRGVSTHARIAGRCSVFAKSDMIHAQQKGFSPEEILKGLTIAVARNFKSAVIRGGEVVPPVLFIGGVAANEGVVDALRDLFELGKGELLVPEHFTHFSSMGCALIASQREEGGREVGPDFGATAEGNRAFSHHPPLSTERVVFLRDFVGRSEDWSSSREMDVFLGIDVGSVSTNFALVDERGRVIDEIYVRTEGRPVKVVRENLLSLGEKWGRRVRVVAVGTTGSGRELVGELVGADVVIDEITAHKTGALFVADKYFNSTVDTIFEIGGQDSKYICLKGGVVADFAMNDACAAGTGSFLEEQAEKLGIDLKKDFARLAFSSKTPLRLGERCTVFMEQDVSNYVKRGAPIEDIVAGLAYGIVLNYLNRVVRGRPIGENIYFQGGTAYNDAVVAAFSMVLKKRIVVPPHNGVMGAIGAALVAKEKFDSIGFSSRFRGFDLSRVSLTSRDISCRGCSNECDVKEITIEGERTYWGDKCSEKFRKPSKVPRTPVGEDLVNFKNTLLDEMVERLQKGSFLRVGIPRAMYFYERFPFWAGFFEELGVSLSVTPRTNRKMAEEGFELSVSEPCFPVQAALGHLFHMVREMDDVDFFFLPNVVNAEQAPGAREWFYCPWGQTLPFVAKANPRLCESTQVPFVIPTVYFSEGPEKVAEDLHGSLKKFGFRKRRIKEAVERGYERLEQFAGEIEARGGKVVDELERKEVPAVLLLGRPYNIYDREMNINIPGKIRDYYGMDVIPFEFIPGLEGVDIKDIHENMFWNLGRKILKAARWAREKPHFSIIYITNFKCGPDSFIRHFIEEASGRPYLTLTFDGHGNDAGYMTRVEAYLDSRGAMRWWNERIYERA